MGLQQQIRDDLKTAMKAKDSDRTGAIRIMMGEFARQPGKQLDDDQVIAIIKKLIKSEKELLAAQGNEDSAFLKIVEEYLPRQAGEEEVRTWILANIDFSAFGNKMQAMRPIMQHFGSSVDGNLVKKVLQSID